ncbi:DUF1566 domain-containing protein [Flammeovirga sp. SJP92]|uniref:Lcl C-terminal domain-containing protein n=1 Tax=Flammeovirga sp. SJP92 TaxID=1775430 RepID=UPI0009EDA991|nr:DUF1566 domain-containing protein [Flammeovirga sp. SJP92]
MKKIYIILLVALSILGSAYTINRQSKDNLKYPIVGTNQSKAFDNKKEIKLPKEGDSFYGQNANFLGNTPKYKNNGDGTVTDLVTGLMWQNSLDHNGDGKIDVNDKLSYKDLLKQVKKENTGGYTDWRLPTIKELYSLIMFSGQDINPQAKSVNGNQPFINTDYFDFAYGDTDAGERLIDQQCATSTIYYGEQELVFGVNFADGRIKGYGKKLRNKEKLFGYFLVRGNADYGTNDFKDNGDGTVSDLNTGLMWMKADSKKGMNWEEALKYAQENTTGNHSDWRLPDAKELESIVDYERVAKNDDHPAIDPIFEISSIQNERGENDFAFYWSNTTHENSGRNGGGTAVYVAFGKSLGNMPARPERGHGNGQRPMGPPPGGRPPQGQGQQGPSMRQSNSNQAPNWIDIHGAGSQRSDPKSGDPSKYKNGRGPQGDAIRINNYVRLVRNI